MFKKLLLVSLLMVIPSISYAGDPPYCYVEQDGNPKICLKNFEVENGTLSLVGGKARYVAPTGAASGDVGAVGDCASGACFDGTQGTTLTFNNAGGDATQDYDGTDFTFSKDVTVPDEAYSATTWNASLEVPTKNAVRDQLASYYLYTDATNANYGFGEVALEDVAAGAQQNTAIGEGALKNLTDGDYNTAVGYNALSGIIDTATWNTAVGYSAMSGPLAATAVKNTVVGGENGINMADATLNTCIGYHACQGLTDGDSNTLIGVDAGYDNQTGSSIVGVGYSALANSTGSQQVAVGNNSLLLTTTGVNNTAIGYRAGGANITGSQNTYLGDQAGYQNAIPSASNQTLIGYNTNSFNSNAVVIGNTSVTTVGFAGSGVGSNPSTKTLSLLGTSARTIGVERNTSSASSGSSLTINAGGAVPVGALVSGGLASAPTAGGTGYTVGDILTISTGDNNATAAVTTVSGGAVTAVTRMAPGSGYSVGTGQATTGGTGTGCTLNITAVATSTDKSGGNLNLACGTSTGNGGCVVNVQTVGTSQGAGSTDRSPVTTSIFGGTAATAYLDLGPAGVRLSTDGDGAITFLGLGNGSDEDFTINIDDTADTAVLSSSTSLSMFDWGTIGANYDDATLEIPNSTTLPATCTIGQVYMDTDATTGQRIYACESANTWALQGDGGSGTVFDTDASTTGHVVKVGCTDDINTAITAATAGDTLVLGSCTYTITSALAVSKALNIRGQGPNATIIASSTGTLNLITITADNTHLSNLAVSNTGAGSSTGIKVDGAAGTIFSNVTIRNVKVTMSGTGSQIGVDYRDAGGYIDGLEISSTSSNSNGTGIRHLNLSTAEAATTLKAYNLRSTVSSGGSTSYAIAAQDSSATQNGTFTVRGCYGVVTESGASTTSAANATGDSAFLVLDDCYLSGTDSDISTTTSGTLTLTPTVQLANGTQVSPISYSGILRTSRVQSDGPIKIVGNAADEMGMERNTTAATAGQNLTIMASGATSGSTNKDGGDIIIQPGVSTGTGVGAVRLKTYTSNASSGTSDNSANDRLIIPPGESVTDGVATAVFSIGVANGTTCGGMFTWSVAGTDGTNLQIHSGQSAYAIVNKAGTFTTDIQNVGTEAKAVSAGTVTTAWTITTSGTTATFNVNTDSSLTQSAGHPRVTYTIQNNCYQTVTT